MKVFEIGNVMYFYGMYNYFCLFRRNKLKQKPVKNLSKCQKKEKKVKNNTHVSLRLALINNYNDVNNV